MQHANQLEQFLQKDKTKRAEVKKHAENAKIFVHAHVKNLIKDFILYKKTHGTQKEKEYYVHMTEKKFIQMLMKKKYFTFFKTSAGKNQFIINDGNQETKFNNFNEWKMYQISYEQSEDFNIEKSLTIDEIKIASFISTTSQTHFINRGDRNNNAKIATGHLSQGYFAAQVGCCFEAENWLEWQDILITKAQNTKENGYGSETQMMSIQVKTNQIWEQFYSLINEVKKKDQLLFDAIDSVIKNFQTYHKETKIDQIQYVKLTANEENPIYFYINAYKARMKAILVPFLKMAEQVGMKEKKDIALYVTGLGLGAWSELPEPYEKMQTIRILPFALQKEFQAYFAVTVDDKINLLQYLCAYLQIKIYEDYFKTNKNTKIKELYFAWFLNNKDSTDTMLKLNSYANLKNEIKVKEDGRVKELTKWNKTDVFWTTLPPASSYFEKEDRINVSNFAWDGATHVGNEYWLGEQYLSQSADPAAVACSHIGTYQNPWINETLLENIEFVE